ncbi:MAG TPA: hypothetical protein DCS93_15150 [Microscillaceae bacterium]|nr:hypothetical protein [Microscillaceae bacterium]
MKTNIIRLFILITIVAGVLSFSFRPTAPKATEYMYITVHEPFIDGGKGHSNVMITDASGNSLETIRIKLPYSMGVSHKKIKKSDSALITLLNKYTKEGWKVKSVAVYEKTYVTKYLLTKD